MCQTQITIGIPHRFLECCGESYKAQGRVKSHLRLNRNNRRRCGSYGLAAGVLPSAHFAIPCHLLAASHIRLRHRRVGQAGKSRSRKPKRDESKTDNRSRLSHVRSCYLLGKGRCNWTHSPQRLVNECNVPISLKMPPQDFGATGRTWASLTPFSFGRPQDRGNDKKPVPSSSTEF
jgi:hypothetical protein